MVSRLAWGTALVALLALPVNTDAQGRGNAGKARVEKSNKGNGPAFCRSGAGHPVFGWEWCRDKGWAGDPRSVWERNRDAERARQERIILDRERERERERERDRERARQRDRDRDTTSDRDTARRRWPF